MAKGPFALIKFGPVCETVRCVSGKLNVPLSLSLFPRVWFALSNTNWGNSISDRNRETRLTSDIYSGTGNARVELGLPEIVSEWFLFGSC